MENFSEQINLSVNADKRYLSSETKIFKSERFFSQTQKVSEIDSFMLLLGEHIQLILGSLEKLIQGEKRSKIFKLETLDKQLCFQFMLGCQAEGAGENTFDQSKLSAKDVVFLSATFSDDVRSNDQRVINFLKRSKIFSVIISLTEISVESSQLSKLYHVFKAAQITLPLLSGKQKELVEIENKNVMVQGVAGSGKTNICISKIIFCACRNYSGRVLYSTFSKGLLVDTKNKVELFKNNILDFIESYREGKVTFLDKNHQVAIQNRLGIELPEKNEKSLVDSLVSIADFLQTHVDYLLSDELYSKFFGEQVSPADEKFFENEFLKSLGNHQLRAKLEKLKNLSHQVIFKEIYGMIFGFSDSGFEEMLPLEKYMELRKNSFDKTECEVIYGIAKEYQKFKKSQNVLDNNDISRKILKNIEKIPKYSLCILDEVQDFTQINLKVFSEISLKMFCVGDALQMINPSYFNFAFLKNLMYREDTTDVAELENNYRNNYQIAELLNALGEINVREFGTHSFVLSTKSVDGETKSNLVFTDDRQFLQLLKSRKFENFTVIAPDDAGKSQVKQILPRQEVLTVSEIKGLERDTVLLFEVLSASKDKWDEFIKLQINHKECDENSVFRFYFNLFYVALSRARKNVFVFEPEKISVFEEFFHKFFKQLDGKNAFNLFSSITSSIEIDDDELLLRINDFIRLGQFDNARFYLGKFEDALLSQQMAAKIDAYEKFVFKGKNREAGIMLWKAGLLSDAKQQFEISGDASLIALMQNLESKNHSNLSIDVVKFFPEFVDNPDAQKLIVEVVRQDLDEIRKKHSEIKSILKNFKEKKNG